MDYAALLTEFNRQHFQIGTPHHGLTVTCSPDRGDGWIAQVSGLPSFVGTESQRISEQTRLARQTVEERYDVLEITGDATADDHTVIVFFRGNRR